MTGIYVQLKILKKNNLLFRLKSANHTHETWKWRGRLTDWIWEKRTSSWFICMEKMKTTKMAFNRKYADDMLFRSSFNSNATRSSCNVGKQLTFESERFFESFYQQNMFQARQNTKQRRKCSCAHHLTRFGSFSSGFKYFSMRPWKNCISDVGSGSVEPSPAWKESHLFLRNVLWCGMHG